MNRADLLNELGILLTTRPLEDLDTERLERLVEFLDIITAPPLHVVR